jgi:nucleoside-diphosphate-sugar epimerase
MSLKGKRILVTGHDGFIGRKLVEELESNDNEVVGFDHRDGIDIRNWEQIREFRDIDMIYHLAAITFVPYSFENPRETYEVNVLGTLNILELARQMDVEKIITMSSYVYGRPKYLPIDENHPLSSNNPYTGSKLVMEQLCKAYSSDFGLNCVIFRPFNIYGAGQNGNFLIPSIINQLKEGKIELKDPEPKRDFIYVTDVIDALIKAGNFKGDENVNIFNIGYGKSYSVKEIVDKIVELHGKPVEVKYTGERRPNEVMDTVANIDKARNKLGWNPIVDLESGLRKVMDEII